MPLTRRDAATTILLIGVVLTFYLTLNGTDLVVLDNTRGALLVIGALGLGMCIVGNAGTMQRSNYTILQSVLGVAALGLIVIGLITAEPIMLTLLTRDITVMWAATLIHRRSIRPVPGASRA